MKTSAYGLGFQRLPRDLANVNAWKTMFDPYLMKAILSYDVAVIQWIRSYHKNRMTTRVIILWCVKITPLTTSVSTMRFLIEIMFTLKAIKFDFTGSYYKQNLTLMDISYEFIKLAEGSFHKFHMK